MPGKEKPQRREVPFIEILKQSAKIIWENKYLLWFGFLIALGSPGSLNYSGGDNRLEEKGGAAVRFFEAHPGIVLAAFIIVFAIGIILFLISLVGRAGLIKSVNLIATKKKSSFKNGWKDGRKYLGKLVKLFLLFFLAVFAIILVLGIPVIYSVMTGSWINAVFVGILAVAIFIPLIFVLALTNLYAGFYIILSELNVWPSIETGYNLLLKNIKNSIIFGLLLIAISVAAGIILLPAALLTAVVLIPTGTLLFFLNKIIFTIFLVFAILFFLLVLLLVSSVFAAYKTTAWTLFFREIAKTESKEAEKVPEAELVKEISPTPVPSGLGGPENA